MSPTEVAWRVRAELRDRVDRLLLDRRGVARPLNSLLQNGRPAAPGFRVFARAVGPWPVDSGLSEAAIQRLVAAADMIAAGRLSYFDLENHALGDPVVWNRDPKRDQPTPMHFAGRIDYRDVSEAGDCKFVWEPNRHHQLVVLARAYRATGARHFAEAVTGQLDSWLAQCPYGRGMNWRSPLELGIRLINWVWALDLVREAGVVTPEFEARLLNAVHLHIWEIARKYSRGSSANNHLIGEAAGVYIAAAYYPELKDAARRRRQALDLLCEEIVNQSYPDGGTREQALGYQLFVLQFYLVVVHAAQRIGDDLPDAFIARLKQMLRFVATLLDGGPLPLYGDDDCGYVLDLGAPRNEAAWLLAAGGLLLEDSEFVSLADGRSEPLFWLADGQWSAVSTPPSRVLEPIAHADTGVYLLQCGRTGERDRISVSFDCGALGMGTLAAHGHADALSFTLRAFGVDVLVDPGTYDYFTYPEWRQYFRSTRAHNTVCIDGADQSEMQGLFLWGKRAEARCTAWEPRDGGGRVAGEHTGYRRFAPPVTHRRTLELDSGARELTIVDELAGARGRRVELYFHGAETCTASTLDDGRVELDTGLGKVWIDLEPRLERRVLRGSTSPIGGWVSRGYHQKAPAPTIVAGLVSDTERVSILTRVSVQSP